MADRIISSSTISSESLNNLSDAGERLFWRLIASDQTDAWGRHDASTRKLRADCVPLLDWEDGKLMQAVEELVREGLCELYCVDGRYYLRVTHWDLYQRTIARLRRGRSRLPDPPGGQVSVEATGERASNERRTSGGRDGLILKALGSTVYESSAAQSVQSPLAESSRDEEDQEQAEERAPLGWFLEQVPGASGRTAAAVSTLQRKYALPEAAFHAALEELRNGGPAIRNKPGLVVAKLKEYGESGRYGRG